MTKIRIELDNTGWDHQVFKSKEEWDAYLRPLTSIMGRGKTHYAPQPRDLYPDKFPCMMIYNDNAIIGCPDGNDEFPNMFVYDFEILDPEDED